MVELLHGSFRPFNGQAPEPALVKRLRVGFTGQQKAEFLNDADIIAQFRHENVLEIKGVISHTMPLLSVYEYMEHPFADEFLRVRLTLFNSQIEYAFHATIRNVNSQCGIVSPYELVNSSGRSNAPCYHYQSRLISVHFRENCQYDIQNS